MRRYLSALALAAVAALAAPVRAGTPAPGFTDSLVVGGLSAPTAIAFLPNGTLLITQEGGSLKLFDGSTTTALVTIPVCSSPEMGLLGIAVDPGFSSNGFIYLYRTNPDAGCGTSVGRFNEVVRVTLSGGSVDLASLTVLLSGIVTDNGNHDGGVVRIGPDQKLYVGVGDSGNGDNQGGPGSSTNPYAQDLTSLNGKILRLNLDGSAPADNPFVGMGSDRPEIWAYGFRNPFRMSFDGATGKLWIGDVGDLTIEEIDIGVAGGNYSWPRCEGNLQGPPNGPQPCVYGSDIAPVFTYPHSGSTSLGTCLIGGAFAGGAFGAMAGEYVFGDCTSSRIYRVALNAARDGFAGTPAPISTGVGTPTDFVLGPDGAMYYVAEAAGEVHRLAAAPSGADALVTGKSLRLADNPAHVALKAISLLSLDPTIDLGGGPGSADDPTVSGGSLRVVSTVAGFDNTYALPASGWHYVGSLSAAKGYRYADLKRLNGPVQNIVLMRKRVLAWGRGSSLGHTLGSNPDPVSIVLQTGSKHYCMSFGTSAGAATRFTADKQFNALNASAPAACAP